MLPGTELYSSLNLLFSDV